MIYSLGCGKKVGENMNCDIKKIPHFRFWCQKVIPLVYDDSLSYYELLCKVVYYLNEIIGDVNHIVDDVDELKAELRVVQEWIENFDTHELEQLISENLMKMIIVGLNDDGYVVYTIPDGWDSIEFNTTGLDINLPLQPEYGHLVLSY